MPVKFDFWSYGIARRFLGKFEKSKIPEFLKKKKEISRQCNSDNRLWENYLLTCERPLFLRFQATIFKENIQNKLIYAILV